MNVTTTDQFQPSDEALAIHRAMVKRLDAEMHERGILKSPGVAEGIAEANATIENWRRSHG